MAVRARLLFAAVAIGTVAAVLTVPTAQSAVQARCKVPVVPKPSTSVQTSSSQAQVRFAAGANVTKYRLHWSPAPFGNWPGYSPNTVFYSKAARVVPVNLPAVGSGDKFLNVNYGNPIFAQLQVGNACYKGVRQSPYVPVWPKPKSPGSSATGDALAVGSYNVENNPTNANTTKMANITANLNSKNLAVVLLQEASYKTATDLAGRLDGNWSVVGAGNDGYTNQQIIYRSDRFSVDGSGRFGQRPDSSASTPLPTPWARLLPVAATPGQQGLFVVAAHLEESKSTSIPAKKAAAHAAAVALLKSIAGQNTGPAVPVIVAGDLKGNFNAYCDEKSRPACVGEGQPTFIRAGFYDAQAAVSKVGIAYATVNKHAANQLANRSGFGGRADYILIKGFTGSARYEVVRHSGAATSWPDHNLIVANLFIPHLS